MSRKHGWCEARPDTKTRQLTTSRVEYTLSSSPRPPTARCARLERLQRSDMFFDDAVFVHLGNFFCFFAAADYHETCIRIGEWLKSRLVGRPPVQEVVPTHVPTRGVISEWACSTTRRVHGQADEGADCSLRAHAVRDHVGPPARARVVARRLMFMLIVISAFMDVFACFLPLARCLCSSAHDSRHETPSEGGH